MISYEITLKGLTPDQASKVCELVDLINKDAVENIAVKESEQTTDCWKTDCIRYDVQNCDTCDVCKNDPIRFYYNKTDNRYICRNCIHVHEPTHSDLCRECVLLENRTNLKLQPGLKNVQ